MKVVNPKRVLNIKTKPKIKGLIELKSVEDLKKLAKINLVPMYEDENEKIYFIANFFYREEKPKKEEPKPEEKTEEKKE